ncbi:hypothetical protein N826_23970 [Skermanella aerolata KACC 11604]|nr:hypothetical protein N826_23970 [Skermanella aerolata KACC 11604]
MSILIHLSPKQHIMIQKESHFYVPAIIAK